jgi:tetratricopeptide (TPR) repeat protein
MTLSFSSPNLPGSGASKTVPRVVLELFVIICLCVCYYFLVRNFALGVGNNHTNSCVFAACAKTNYCLNELYDVWKGRLSGMLLSGALFDLSVKDASYQIEQYAMFFGLYQAIWLLVLLLTMLVAVRESLLVNLGIFAGLIYNFEPSAGCYFYPWDLPATVFLTLAVLLHERGHRVLMLGAIGVGCFFKETVLVGAILCLFSREWKWRWRLLSFVGLAAFYILGKRCLMDTLHLKTAVLAMGDSTHMSQLLRADYLVRNLKLLFSDKATQVLFANAGTLVAVLVLGWEKRFRPYLWMIMAYVVGQFMYGEFNEVRIFMQVLPLSCLVLSEYAQGWTRRSADAAALPQSSSGPDQPGRMGKRRVKAPKPVAGKSVPARKESAWACRKSDRGLIKMAVVVMVISSSVVVLAYAALLGSCQPEYQARLLKEFKTRAERGEPAAQYALGNCYYYGPGNKAQNWAEAFYWFREAAGRGYAGAQLKLGLCYLQGEGTAQSYEASIPWFRKVAALNNQEVRCYFGLVYNRGSGAKRDLADHFLYLAWLGPLALAAAGLVIVVAFILRRKSFFDPALGVAVVLAVGALSWRWKYDGVETLWQSVITRDPNCYLARKNLGYALLETGQTDKVLTYFQKAVKLEPDDTDNHFNLACAFSENGQLDEAIIHFQKAVDLDPDDPILHSDLGFVLAKKGQLDEAIRQFHEALRLKPDLAEASNNLAVTIGLKEAAAKPPSPSTKP